MELEKFYEKYHSDGVRWWGPEVQRLTNSDLGGLTIELHRCDIAH